MTTLTGSNPSAEPLAARLRATRERSVALASPLSDADASAQSMPDASPAKWHLAHTTWFFETFVLRDHVPGYRPADPTYAYLFNSYYEAEGARLARDRRGLITRPGLTEVLAYRAHVDAALASATPRLPEAGRMLVELGIAHEEQHQELLLTDVKHLFAQNPIEPALWPPEAQMSSREAVPTEWIEHPGGVVSVGHGRDGFGFDCEGPRHDALLRPFALARRTVTNREWMRFIADGGYAEPRWWLADGWAWLRREGIEAPLYWRAEGETWTRFGLDGRRPIDPAAPVAHISLYEADAYASYMGARLPTETEWEAVASAHDPHGGDQLDGAGPVEPRPSHACPDLFGGVWEWTGSAFRPYPGFRAAGGAVGEYNGKFMSGQFVLRGGSCATPRGHLRASYRNFFPPDARWQFTGVRLARDL